MVVVMVDVAVIIIIIIIIIIIYVSRCREIPIFKMVAVCFIEFMAVVTI